MATHNRWRELLGARRLPEAAAVPVATPARPAPLTVTRLEREVCTHCGVELALDVTHRQVDGNLVCPGCFAELVAERREAA